MAGFMQGILLGGSNMFSGSSKGSESDGGAASRARTENIELRNQIRGLRAELAGVEAVRDALMIALHAVAPDNSLVNPFEAGQNPSRNTIYDQAYDAAMHD